MPSRNLNQKQHILLRRRRLQNYNQLRTRKTYVTRERMLNLTNLLQQDSSSNTHSPVSQRIPMNQQSGPKPQGLFKLELRLKRLNMPKTTSLPQSYVLPNQSDLLEFTSLVKTKNLSKKSVELPSLITTRAHMRPEALLDGEVTLIWK